MVVRGNPFIQRQTSNPSPGPEAAFTLVELLVVIAVIAILGSLLLPALNRGKQAADNTVCRSNLRQQGLGLAMYVSDLGAYPPVRWSTPKPWMQSLEKYAGDKWPSNGIPGEGSHGRRPGTGVYACPGYNR